MLFLQINLRQDLFKKKTRISQVAWSFLSNRIQHWATKTGPRECSPCAKSSQGPLCLPSAGPASSLFPLWRGGLCLSALLSMGSRLDPTCWNSQPLSYNGFQVFLDHGGVQFYFSLR